SIRTSNDRARPTEHARDMRGPSSSLPWFWVLSRCAPSLDGPKLAGVKRRGKCSRLDGGRDMQKFIKLTAVAAPLPMINVDTDAIIPKQFLKTIKRTGLGKHLFHELRYDEQGKEMPDFVLNKPAYRKAQILVAGDNFGCGSSREHAPWALL